MSSGGGGTNTTTSSNAPPPQFTAAFQDAVTRAQQVASQPQQQYPGTPGSLVAGFSPDQQAAIGTIQGAQGIAAPFINAGAQEVGASTAPLTPTIQPYADNAAGFAYQAGAPVTPGQIANVENPFTQQVVNATQNQFNNQNAQRAAGIRGNAISSGAFGGDREGVAQGIAAGQEQLAQAPVIAGLNQSGFNTALQNAMQQKQLDLGAGQGTLAAGSSLLGADEAQRWLESQAGYGLGNFGNEALNSTLTGANAQLGIGGLEQQLAQENLNVPYSQFVAQQAYPFQSTGWLANIEEGLGSASGGTSSTTYPGASAGSQIAGAGLAGAGLIGATGGFGNNGWLTGANGLFGSGGGGAADALVSGAQNAAVSDAFGPTAAGLFGFGQARGGRIPHRASGGIMPVSSAPPMGAGVPGGAGIPDLSVDFIPGGKGGGRPLITGNYGSTSTTSGGGGSDAASALGTIASIAKIVSLFQRGGGVPHRARGGIADFANDDFANDNRFEPPRRAAGGITVDIPQMPSSARGISYVPGGNGIPIPQFNVPGGSGPPPSGGGGGGIAGVNDYLARTQAMAPSAASLASLAPQPMPTAQAAPAPATPLPDDGSVWHRPVLWDPDGSGGRDAGGPQARGGRVPRRAPGGILPAWAGGPPDISLPTAPDVGITDADTTDWRNDPANPTLGGGGGPPELPDVSVVAQGPPPQRHGMPPASGIAAASLPEPPIPPDQAPGGGGIAANTDAHPDTAQPTKDGKPSSKWGEVLLAAGLGMMGGTSPNALTNIGRGGLEGLKFGEQQRMREEQAELRRLQQQDSALYRKGLLEVQNRKADTGDTLAAARSGELSARTQLETVKALHALNGSVGGGGGHWSYVGVGDDGKPILLDSKSGQTKSVDTDIGMKPGEAARVDQAGRRLDQGDASLDIRRAGQAMTAADHADRAQARANSGEDASAMRIIGSAALLGKTIRYTDALAEARRARAAAGPAPLPGASGGGSGGAPAPAAPAIPALRPGQKPTLNDFLGE